MSTRVLLFALSERSWAIPLERVSAIGRCERLCPVPGSPSGVLGLAEYQAVAVAVLDCARLLGERPRAEESCLVVLAPPHERTALFISSRVELGLADTQAAAGEVLTVNGVNATLVDPAALLRLVEDELRGR